VTRYVTPPGITCDTTTSAVDTATHHTPDHLHHHILAIPTGAVFWCGTHLPSPLPPLPLPADIPVACMCCLHHSACLPAFRCVTAYLTLMLPHTTALLCQLRLPPACCHGLPLPGGRTYWFVHATIPHLLHVACTCLPTHCHLCCYRSPPLRTAACAHLPARPLPARLLPAPACRCLPACRITAWISRLPGPLGAPAGFTPTCARLPPAACTFCRYLPGAWRCLQITACAPLHAIPAILHACLCGTRHAPHCRYVAPLCITCGCRIRACCRYNHLLPAYHRLPFCLPAGCATAVFAPYLWIFACTALPAILTDACADYYAFAGTPGWHTIPPAPCRRVIYKCLPVLRGFLAHLRMPFFLSPRI